MHGKGQQLVPSGGSSRHTEPDSTLEASDCDCSTWNIAGEDRGTKLFHVEQFRAPARFAPKLFHVEQLHKNAALRRGTYVGYSDVARSNQNRTAIPADPEKRQGQAR